MSDEEYLEFLRSYEGPLDSEDPLAQHPELVPEEYRQALFPGGSSRPFAPRTLRTRPDRSGGGDSNMQSFVRHVQRMGPFTGHSDPFNAAGGEADAMRGEQDSIQELLRGGGY